MNKGADALSKDRDAQHRNETNALNDRSKVQQQGIEIIDEQMRAMEAERVKLEAERTKIGKAIEDGNEKAARVHEERSRFMLQASDPNAVLPQVRDLEGKLTALQREVAEGQKDIAEQERRNAALRDEKDGVVERLNRALREVRSAREEQRLRLQQLQREEKILRMTLDNLRAKSARQERNIEDIHTTCEKMEREAAARKADLEEQIRLEQARLASRSADEQRVLDKKAQTEERVADLRAQIEEVEEVLLHQTEQRSADQQEIRKQTARLAVAEHEMSSQLQSLDSKVRDQERATQALSQERAELKARVDEVEAQRAEALQMRQARLQQVADEQAELGRQVGAMKTTLLPHGVKSPKRRRPTGEGGVSKIIRQALAEGAGFVSRGRREGGGDVEAPAAGGTPRGAAHVGYVGALSPVWLTKEVNLDEAVAAYEQGGRASGGYDQRSTASGAHEHGQPRALSTPGARDRASAAAVGERAMGAERAIERDAATAGTNTFRAPGSARRELGLGPPPDFSFVLDSVGAARRQSGGVDFNDDTFRRLTLPPGASFTSDHTLTTGHEVAAFDMKVRRPLRFGSLA